MTKETEKAFKIIYCEYRTRVKKGFTKDNSIRFEDGEIQKLNSFADWMSPDIDSAISELNDNNYLHEDVIGNVILTNEGIQFMQDRPKEFFSDIKSLFDIALLFI